MINLFLIIFFGSVTSLTKNPIDIVTGVNEISLKNPIAAITSGASIELDISSIVPASNTTIFESRKWAEENFPKDCIRVILHKRGYTNPQSKLVMNGIGISNEKTFLILSNVAGIPTKQEFDSITLFSCRSIRKVNLFWKNYQL